MIKDGAVQNQEPDAEKLPWVITSVAGEGQSLGSEQILSDNGTPCLLSVVLDHPHPPALPDSPRPPLLPTRTTQAYSVVDQSVSHVLAPSSRSKSWLDAINYL